MMADVAHELPPRPDGDFRASAKRILDGVYPLDEAQVPALFDETRLLTRLVG